MTGNESGDDAERDMSQPQNFFLILTVAFQGGEVMVWAGISVTVKTGLVFIEVILNAQRCINEVLVPHILSFLRQPSQHST